MAEQFLPNKEKLKGIGKLVIISGRTGAGKDWVVEEAIKRHGLKRIVTHATRKPRTGEIDGRDYHFCSEKDFWQLEFAEEPVPTGTTYKGTSKKELYRIFDGEDMAWRIDLSLADKIVRRKYFKEWHSPENAELLLASSILVLVHAPEGVIRERREQRDGESYDPKDYALRDQQELPIITRSFNLFENVIHNYGEHDPIAQLDALMHGLK